MKIIQQSKRIEKVEYSYHFIWKDDSGSGFGFPCDAQGKILIEGLSEAALNSLSKCQDGTYSVDDLGMEMRDVSYTLPAVGRCNCGRKVTLQGFTIECHCGALYNWAGQKLVAEKEWAY